MITTVVLLFVSDIHRRIIELYVLFTITYLTNWIGKNTCTYRHPFLLILNKNHPFPQTIFGLHGFLIKIILLPAINIDFSVEKKV